MPNIDLLPKQGTHIYTGLVIGKDSAAAKDVVDQFAKDDLDSNGGTGFGGQITFGQDLLSIGGTEPGSTRFVLGAEVSAGFLTHTDSITIGERPYYDVHVMQTDRSWDDYNGQWVYTSREWNRSFYNYDQAAYYAASQNYDNDYYRSTVASNPQTYYENIDKTKNATRASVRVGGSIGVEHRFDGVALRVAGLGGTDVARSFAGYIGGRVSVSGVGDQGGLGGFLQVDSVVSGPLKGDTKTSIGVTGNF